MEGNKYRYSTFFYHANYRYKKQLYSVLKNELNYLVFGTYPVSITYKYFIFLYTYPLMINLVELSAYYVFVQRCRLFHIPIKSKLPTNNTFKIISN